MSTELARKPANVLRTYTQQVRDHSAAMARLQDQYFATLKRAEAQYFEGVKRITDALTHETEPKVAESVEAPSPQA
jgi:cation transport regulator ChaB